MTEKEFRALLAIEGKKLHVSKTGTADDDVYLASVIDAKNIIYDYAYSASKEDALDKLIRNYYADN